jgi:hypothetical protein
MTNFREREEELDYEEARRQKAWPVWPWFLGLIGYLIWKNC